MKNIVFITITFISFLYGQEVPFYFARGIYALNDPVPLFPAVIKTGYKRYKQPSLIHIVPTVFSAQEDEFFPIVLLYAKRDTYALALVYTSTNLCQDISIWNVLLLDQETGSLRFMHQIFGPKISVDREKIKRYPEDDNAESCFKPFEYIKYQFEDDALSFLPQEFDHMLRRQKDDFEAISFAENVYRSQICAIWQPVKYFLANNNRGQSASIPRNTQLDATRYIFSPFCWSNNQTPVLQLNSAIKVFIHYNKHFPNDILTHVLSFLMPISDAFFHLNIKSIEYLKNKDQLSEALERRRDFYDFYRYE